MQLRELWSGTLVFFCRVFFSLSDYKVSHMILLPYLLFSQTSALDSESEASVQEAIDGMLKRERQSHEAGDEENSMTVMVIAHR